MQVLCRTRCGCTRVLDLPMPRQTVHLVLTPEIEKQHCPTGVVGAQMAEMRTFYYADYEENNLPLYLEAK